ncbi:MAG: vitamin B12-dependent ribonucleotide reductase [Clostridiales bacterium]|nr:vitamin B12-dependent ribonucleotide reductase [Clostridiales bacterium]
MSVSKNAEVVLKQRYLKKDENGNSIETVEGMFHRVAKAIAAADIIHDTEANVDETEAVFYHMMSELEFLPNSPTLMNAGKDLGQLSACFVLPVEDSMNSIFEAIRQAALIHKSGGGTGFSFSRIRHEGSTVNSTGGVASGPISFMKVFNAATEAIKQGGSRRGANMGILRIDHPDILKFIDCKADSKEITNFNISVGLTEDFMQAAEACVDYNLIDPHTKEPAGSLDAKLVFDKIVDAAWRNGEPGIIFLDRLNRDNIVPGQGEIEATNPCGEQPLLPHESCNLGSINLTKMVKEEDGKVVFDLDKLEKTIGNSVHFLDNVIDVNQYPLEEIGFATRQTRKIGLGVMGWADVLLMMGIPYNTDEAVMLGEKVMSFITDIGKAESQRLAQERGVFPLFKESILFQETPQRNGTITTIAPTGTLSIIGGCSSGIEPVFAYVFIRNIMDGTELLEVNPVLKAELEKRGLYSEELMRRIAKEGTVSHMKELPQEIRRVFVSTHDISPEYHVRMQAAFQKSTDNAVSKTVNFSNSATKEDVAQVYSLAFSLGCKGVTIYRDGSRDEQVLNIGKVKRSADGDTTIEATVDQGVRIIPRQRPDIVTGVTEKVKIGCGNLYITVNYDEQGICEIFTNTGKAGGCPSQSEATARLASIALRSGIDVKTIVEQLRGIRCPSTIRQQGMKCTSCPDAMARVIEQEYKKQVELGNWMPMSGEPQSRSEAPLAVDDVVIGNFCPECGSPIEHESGCVVCRQCGYSKCG